MIGSRAIVVLCILNTEVLALLIWISLWSIQEFDQSNDFIGALPRLWRLKQAKITEDWKLPIDRLLVFLFTWLYRHLGLRSHLWTVIFPSQMLD